jgi:hypothetical protein
MVLQGVDYSGASAFWTRLYPNLPSRLTLTCVDMSNTFTDEIKEKISDVVVTENFLGRGMEFILEKDMSNAHCFYECAYVSYESSMYGLDNVTPFVIVGFSQHGFSIVDSRNVSTSYYFSPEITPFNMSAGFVDIFDTISYLIDFNLIDIYDPATMILFEDAIEEASWIDHCSNTQCVYHYHHTGLCSHMIVYGKRQSKKRKRLVAW